APLAATFYYFRKNYTFYAPSLKFVDFSYLKNLMPLSFDFFLLSISTLILYFSQNIIITQLLGPEKVAVFNIAYKYFFYIILIQTLILNPVWSASIEAYNLGDLNWIKKIIRKLLKIWVGLVGIIIIMVIFANQFYLLWIKGKVFIPMEVTISMGLYVIFFSWYSNFAYIINGIGKIKLQLYLISSVAIFNIILSIVFIKYLGLGVEGVILSSVLCTIPGALLIPLQLKKILNKKAEGIWLR
ncbi:MAG: polysaccharide biosynthesis C-terminal domain-containing protein, partial [Bacteroidota bacterium]|nr:polysaccharide biosynthesis C-terminal domain-containing protein [Bacteroidota bacterium]